MHPRERSRKHERGVQRPYSRLTGAHATAKNSDTYLRGFPLEQTRLPFLALCILLLASILAACNGASGGDGDSVAEVEVSTRWATAHAQSIEALTEFADEVFVGRVARLVEQQEVAIGPELPAGSPGRPTLPLSRYEVTVEDAILSSLTDGATVVLEQVGGLIGDDGDQRLVILEGDDPLVPGTTYLFFANQKGNGAYSSAPFARFGVGPGQELSAPSFWAHLPAVQTLSGRTVTQAAAEVVSIDN